MTEYSNPELGLATYGTLARGRPNAHQRADLTGDWIEGFVRGKLVEQGWGAAMGYPGIVLDDNGPEVAVHVFVSNDLPAHWTRQDAFEGKGYQRSPVNAFTDRGIIAARIYRLVHQ